MSMPNKIHDLLDKGISCLYIGRHGNGSTRSGPVSPCHPQRACPSLTFTGGGPVALRYPSLTCSPPLNRMNRKCKPSKHKRLFTTPALVHPCQTPGIFFNNQGISMNNKQKFDDLDAMIAKQMRGTATESFIFGMATGVFIVGVLWWLA